MLHRRFDGLVYVVALRVKHRFGYYDLNSRKVIVWEDVRTSRQGEVEIRLGSCARVWGA